jgi:hypothetical protein
MVRLIDQTAATPFFIQTGGPQPATEDYQAQRAIAIRLAAGEHAVLDDESVFPPLSCLPRDVQTPSCWIDSHALVLSARPSGAYVLANLFPITRPPPGELRGRWCVWDDRGVLRHDCDPGLDGERLIDVDWADSRIVELRWTGDQTSDDYVIALISVEDGRELTRATFDIRWSGDARLSAQSLGPLRTSTHWLVWAASGHGEAGFDVIELDGSRFHRRFRMEARYGEPDSDVAPILSPDTRWLAFRSSEGTVIADLAIDEARIMPRED